MSKEDRPKGSAARSWIVLAVAISLVAAGIVFGGRPLLYATGLWVDGSASTIPPTFFDTASTSASAASDAVLEPVLDERTPTLSPANASLAARVKAVPRTGLGTMGLTFVDAKTGSQLYGEAADEDLAPASNMKVLSSLAALDVLGAGTTFSTKVVQTAPGTIVIVGGGDPTLTAKTQQGYPRRPSMQQLAALTAKALKATHTTSVALGYDTSLFSGASWHPDWTESYDSEVSKIVALWVDSGRNTDGYPVQDPVGVAVRAFITELTAQGIKVTSTTSTTAPASATEVAAVQSPPVSVIVEQLLLHSDNDYTEVLARHTAIAAGQPATFEGAATAITQTLAKRGLNDEGTTIRDASGLSKNNRVTPSTLAKAILLGLHSDTLSALLTGLPLAGVSGTLSGRFSAVSGRGQVWAKTGYLNGVHGLTGILVTKDGSIVVFSILVNGQASRGVAQPSLDALTSAVVQCGCQ